MSIRHRIRALAIGAILLIGLGLCAVTGRALADERCTTAEIESDSDHETARRAVECGEVMPLAEVLAAIRSHIPGKIIETEFEREGDSWTYELKILDDQGRIVEMHVDAKTARILDTKGHE
jgi:uncharacterized membrane protein YkoI